MREDRGTRLKIAEVEKTEVKKQRWKVRYIQHCLPTILLALYVSKYMSFLTIVRTFVLVCVAGPAVRSTGSRPPGASCEMSPTAPRSGSARPRGRAAASAAPSPVDDSSQPARPTTSRLQRAAVTLARITVNIHENDMKLLHVTLAS